MTTARLTGERNEALSLRTEYSKVFANPDGTWTEEVATGPEQVQDENGKWHEIDTRLVRVKGGLAPRYAIGDLVLSDGGDADFASVTSDGHKVQWRWPGSLPAPVIDGNTATYPNAAAAGGDLVAIATPTGFQYNIVLKRAPARPVSFTVPVVADGWRLSEGDGGGLEVTTKSGETLVSAPAPVMWDATTENDTAGSSPTEPGQVGARSAEDATAAAVTVPADTVPVDTTIGRNAHGNPTITLSPAQDFLTDPRTVYPVTVDPSWTVMADLDTWAGTPNGSGGRPADEELQVGNSSGTQRARAFLRFGGGNATWAGKDIVSAKLVLRNFNSPSCTGAAILAQRITKQWTNSSLTWANQPTATATGQGSYSQAHGGGTGCPWADATFTITSIVQTWANNTATNFGLRIIANNESYLASFRKYRSANYSSGDLVHPKIVVTYNSYPTSGKPTVAAASAGSSGYVTSSKPTFRATLSDADKGTVRAKFDLYKGTTLVETAWSPYVSSGAVAEKAWPSVIPDGSGYTVRATANDGSLNAKTHTVSDSFTVDTTKPSAPLVRASGLAAGDWLSTYPTTNAFTFTSAADTKSFAVKVNDATAQNLAASNGAAAATSLRFKHGQNKLVVTAIDKAGNTSAATTFSFGLGAPDFLDLDEGARSTGVFPIRAAGQPGANRVDFFWRYQGTANPWQPLTGVKKPNGTAWPNTEVSANVDGASVTPVLTWDATNQQVNPSEGEDTLAAPTLLELQVRFSYPDGSTVTSTDAGGRQLLQLVPSAFGGNFPTTEVGPATVALHTGEMSYEEADAVDTAAGVGRTFAAFDPSTMAVGPTAPVSTGTSDADHTLFVGEVAAEHKDQYLIGLFRDEDDPVVPRIVDDSGFDPDAPGTYTIEAETTDGNGDHTSKTLEVVVWNLIQISKGQHHTLALDSLGRAWGWSTFTGDNDNAYGQVLADGTTTKDLTTPALVQGLPNRAVKQVLATESNSYFLIEGGAVYAVGDCSMGQLGDWSNWTAIPSPSSAVPVRTRFLTVPGTQDDAEIVKLAGTDHSIAALDSDGAVWTWGAGANGQQGRFVSNAVDVNNRSGPVRSFGPATVADPVPQTTIAATGVRVVDLAQSANGGTAVLSDGRVFQWGMDNNGQFGDGVLTAASYRPTQAGSASVRVGGAALLPGDLDAADPDGVGLGAYDADGDGLWDGYGSGVVSVNRFHTLVLRREAAGSTVVRQWGYGNNNSVDASTGGRFVSGAAGARTPVLLGVSPVHQTVAAQNWSVAIGGSGQIFGTGQNGNYQQFHTPNTTRTGGWAASNQSPTGLGMLAVNRTQTLALDAAGRRLILGGATPVTMSNLAFHNDEVDDSVHTGALGPGWSTTIIAEGDTNASLIDNRGQDGTFVLVTAGGSSETFVRDSGGTYKPAGVDDGSRLVVNDGIRTATLTRPHSTVTKWTYDEDWGAWELTEAASSLDAAASPEVRVTTRNGFPEWIAQTPPGESTTCTKSTQAPGCRGLRLTYTGTGAEKRVVSIDRIAHGTEPLRLATYVYDGNGLLESASGIDPDGDGPRQPLRTRYTYDTATVDNRVLLKTVTPPGQAAWTFDYDQLGRLTNVTRPLDEVTNAGSGNATWTVVYNHRLDITSDRLPDLTRATVERWGQDAAPTRVNAVFEPTHIPASSPSEADLAHAALWYTDGLGATTNTAVHGGVDPSQGSGQGQGRWLVDTIWYDEYGNVVRSLDAAGRARALDADPDDRAAVALAASSITRYDQRGLRIEDEYGPVHTATLEDDTIGEYRAHTSYTYDDENTNLGGAGKPAYNPAVGLTSHNLLVQMDTSAAEPDMAATGDRDVKSIRYFYNRIVDNPTTDANGWELASPTQMKAQRPNGTWALTKTVRYDTLGREIETRQFEGATHQDGSAADAHATAISYYAKNNSADNDCNLTGHPGRTGWEGQVCKSGPAAQPAGTPIPVTWYQAYNDDLQPVTVVETSSGTTRRSTSTSYDLLGRVSSVSVTDGDDNRTQNLGYDEATGAATRVGGTGAPTTVAYDSWGRVRRYIDGNDQETTHTYTVSGQVATTTDVNGTTSYAYDDANGEHRGVVSSMSIAAHGASATSTFRLGYDAAGNQTTVVYPNGITAVSTYDTAGAATGLDYLTPGGDGLLSFTNTVDVVGMVTQATSPESANAYEYDTFGRLTTVNETRDSLSTTRVYGFNAASDRSSFASYAGDEEGGFQTHTPTVSKTWSYDAANRITGGYDYDHLGRATTVPVADTSAAEDANAGPLSVDYYANDMVASLVQTGSDGAGQDGTETKRANYTLDATGRISRITNKTDGIETERLRYEFGDDSDSPIAISSSTNDGATWATTGYLSLPGSGMVASLKGGTLTYHLSNLHGDTVAQVSDTTGESIDSYTETDEYGNELGTAVERYGWLGSYQRSTDTVGGVVLMGARLYNPTSGQFLSPDPVLGGNQTAYTYPEDPINFYDITGEWGVPKWIKSAWSVVSKHKKLVLFGLKAGLKAATYAVCAGLNVGYQICRAVLSALIDGAHYIATQMWVYGKKMTTALLTRAAVVAGGSLLVGVWREKYFFKTKLGSKVLENTYKGARPFLVKSGLKQIADALPNLAWKLINRI